MRDHLMLNLCLLVLCAVISSQDTPICTDCTNNLKSASSSVFLAIQSIKALVETTCRINPEKQEDCEEAVSNTLNSIKKVVMEVLPNAEAGGDNRVAREKKNAFWCSTIAGACPKSTSPGQYWTCSDCMHVLAVGRNISDVGLKFVNEQISNLMCGSMASQLQADHCLETFGKTVTFSEKSFEGYRRRNWDSTIEPK